MKGKRVLLLASIILLVLANGVALAQQPKPVVLTANLTFQQEVLANPNTRGPSAGVGAAVFVLSADRTKVDFAVTFVGLGSVVRFAHIHDSPTATFGVNAGVKRDFCGTAATPACEEGRLYTGTWSTTDMVQPLAQADIDALLAGTAYVNVHTAANLPGEIRGQVTPISPK